MLASLSIRDIVLIDKLDLHFSDGMSVLTGETGAGKSILLDSLSLALGGRGDAGLVRHGEDRGQVTAVFDVPMVHPLRALLQENDLEHDADIILRRVQASDGRTRAFVNDSPVSAGLLRQIGALLVEVHGQHDDRALIDPESHRQLLDSFGGLEGDAAKVSESAKAVRKAEKTLKDHVARIEEARREADYLRSSADELSTLDPKEGEENELALRRQDMMQVEKIAGDLREGYEALDGPASPIPELSSLLRRLERKVDLAPNYLTSVVEAIGGSLDQLEEARGGLEQALRDTDFDPQELEQTEERLFALRAAARKYSVQPDELGKLREQMEGDLSDLDAGEEKLQALESAVEAAKQTYDKLAAALSKKRQKTAKALEDAVHAELPALKLERARFIIDIESDEEQRGSSGIDTVEFWAQTNPGTRPGPMFKVASGGELSRFLLALKVSLADKGSSPTLVFDEIDTGVGGAVAEAIGVRLARLANSVQVLTVTHAPQVAARANGHFLIRKDEVEKDRVATRVTEIAQEDRHEEIARMLAGSTITEEARAAAKRLMGQEELV
ncbi:DNA repair protein RecN [Pseudovibrio brasiliensis]|uniref:DNA repair protein RecN n=1 Tax=Pseudovibrio brasiliensis TaxID=1898042 RepID=A0ABX8AMI1_9HYPH|nr:DNA repair protein RecN [Pseudovibrio brasiliensis]QUS54864.1 DNA repair protein RecN [Pseudovibrio brasiliensis]